MVAGVDDTAAGKALVFHHIAHAALDIFLQLLTLGIAVAPLRGVAVGSHLLSCIGKDGKEGINIGVCSRADGQNNYEL